MFVRTEWGHTMASFWSSLAICSCHAFLAEMLLFHYTCHPKCGRQCCIQGMLAVRNLLFLVVINGFGQWRLDFDLHPRTRRLSQLHGLASAEHISQFSVQLRPVHCLHSGADYGPRALHWLSWKSRGCICSIFVCHAGRWQVCPIGAAIT